MFWICFDVVVLTLGALFWPILADAFLERDACESWLDRLLAPSIAVLVTIATYITLAMMATAVWRHYLRGNGSYLLLSIIITALTAVILYKIGRHDGHVQAIQDAYWKKREWEEQVAVWGRSCRRSADFRLGDADRRSRESYIEHHRFPIGRLEWQMRPNGDWYLCGVLEGACSCGEVVVAYRDVTGPGTGSGDYHLYRIISNRSNAST